MNSCVYCWKELIKTQKKFCCSGEAAIGRKPWNTGIKMRERAETFSSKISNWEK